MGHSVWSMVRIYKKSWPISYNNLIYKLGQDFLQSSLERVAHLWRGTGLNKNLKRDADVNKYLKNIILTYSPRHLCIITFISSTMNTHVIFSVLIVRQMLYTSLNSTIVLTNMSWIRFSLSFNPSTVRPSVCQPFCIAVWNLFKV